MVKIALGPDLCRHYPDNFLRLSHYFGVTFNKRLHSFCELLPLLESERRIIQDVMVVSQWTCGLTVSWPLHSLYPISKHQPDYEKSVSLRLYARSSQTSTWHQGSYIAHLLYCLKPTGFRSSHWHSVKFLLTGHSPSKKVWTAGQ